MSLLALTICLALAQVQDEVPPLGTNLAPFTEASLQWPLVNVFKMAKPWTSSNSEQLDVDEHGNVKSLKAGQSAVTVIYSKGHYPKGTYTLTWKGAGEFEVPNNWDKLTLESPGNAKLEVASLNGIELSLKSVDPKDPPREISLVMPGYEETAETEPFHPIFLQRMSLYRVVRLTNWQAARAETQKTWKDRAVLEDSTYTRGKGVPLEVMVDLANTKFALPWFSVPVQADDDYVREMASLIKARLRAELKVAIEFSNLGYLKGDGRPADDASLKAYAKRSQQVFAIFEDVFGGKARLIRVVAGPMDDPKAVATILGWEQTASKADALAVQPRFLGDGAGNLDAVFERAKTFIAGDLRDQMFEAYGIAQRHGLRLFASDGGVMLVHPGTPLGSMDFGPVLRDPRMSETYTTFLKTWRSAGGMLFVHTLDCGEGGAVERQDQDPQTSMINRALIQYGLFPDR